MTCAEMDENISDPVGIILVSSGSKGDRMLFRYPFESTGNSEESVKCESSSSMRMSMQ
jgi:transcription termination factor Rho